MKPKHKLKAVQAGLMLKLHLRTIISASFCFLFGKHRAGGFFCRGLHHTLAHGIRMVLGADDAGRSCCPDGEASVRRTVRGSPFSITLNELRVDTAW